MILKHLFWIVNGVLLWLYISKSSRPWSSRWDLGIVAPLTTIDDSL